MTRMIACMRFQPRSGKADELMKAIAEYNRDYPFTESLHMGIIDLGTGEFALIGVHNSVDAFVDIMNRDVRISEIMREFVEPYEDGEAFHSFSGPEVDLKVYLQRMRSILMTLALIAILATQAWVQFASLTDRF